MDRPQMQRTFRGKRPLRVESLESRAMLHATGLLSGSVFLDTDGNGVRSASEVGVPGVVIRLSDASSSAAFAVRSTITDDSGAYTFDELEPGTYQIAKRSSPAVMDDSTSGSGSGTGTGSDLLTNVVLTDDQSLSGNDFGEASLRPEFINIGWFFASAPPTSKMLRETIALSEELAGDSELANSIRTGGSEVPGVPDVVNHAPIVTNDVYSVDENEVLTVSAATGLLVNDSDVDGDALTATLVDQPDHGVAVINENGSFTYTPTADFSGIDTFSYRASDGLTMSNVGTVRIDVTPVDTSSQLFASVTPGEFDAAGLLGVRTDLVTGAPAITRNHVNGDIDYTGYSNPPTYGDHHGFDPQGTDSNPGITPRPTGIYTTEQPDEDLIHNMEHGHVWISYNPSLINAGDLAALQQLLRDGTGDTNGGGAGVILTPRSANDKAIALASWAHLLTLDSFNATTIRSFIETNRGHAPEGFITP